MTPLFTSRKPAAFVPAVGFLRRLGLLAALLLVASFVSTAVSAREAPKKEQKSAEKKNADIEMRINGESVTKTFLQKGLDAVGECAPQVCPTDAEAGWEKRRSRLIRLVALRQFLDRQKIVVPDKDIAARIERMKREPNPFNRYPPKPLGAVMVRECIPWEDLRLMIRVDFGLRHWAEREWTRRWPDKASWLKHCRAERPKFEEEFGCFRRLSFSLARWPKGAKTENEALEILKKQAAAAKRRLDGGEAFEKLARELAGQKGPGKAGKKEAAPAGLLPFAVLGKELGGKLRALRTGEVSAPLRTRFGWNIFKREAVSEEALSRALKQRFMVRVRAEAEKRIAKKTKVEKVNWRRFDEE